MQKRFELCSLSTKCTGKLPIKLGDSFPGKPTCVKLEIFAQLILDKSFEFDGLLIMGKKPKWPETGRARERLGNLSVQINQFFKKIPDNSSNEMISKINAVTFPKVLSAFELQMAWIDNKALEE